MSQELSIFIPGDDGSRFQAAMEMAKILGSSSLVPEIYRAQHASGPANCLIAIDLAKRLDMNPLEVMQNLEIVEGNPSWKSKYIIERLERAVESYKYEYINAGDKAVQYEFWTGPKGQREKKTGTVQIKDVKCRVVAQHKGETITGPWVSIEMAVREGWYTRNGSKWPTMPEKMLTYAAVRDFNKLYPVVSMVGMPTSDEVYDAPEYSRKEATTSVVEDLNKFAEAEVVDDKPARKSKSKPVEVEQTEPASADDEEMI